MSSGCSATTMPSSASSMPLQSISTWSGPSLLEGTCPKSVFMAGLFHALGMPEDNARCETASNACNGDGQRSNVHHFLDLRLPTVRLGLRAMNSNLDFVSHLAHESGRFAAAVAETVPTTCCGTSLRSSGSGAPSCVRHCKGHLSQRSDQPDPPADPSSYRSARRLVQSSFPHWGPQHRKTGCGPGRMTIALPSSAVAKSMRR